MTRVGKLRLMLVKISSPRPPPLTYAPIVAMPITVTVAILTPAIMTGSANGSSTLKRICREVRPMPRAASLVSSGTESIPATTLRIRTRSEYATSAMMTACGPRPMPGTLTSSAKAARDGIEKSSPVTNVTGG
jgi:hypothetical protein